MANRFLSNIRINDAYTFPASDGTNGQVITTDGSGNLSFSDIQVTGAESNFIYYNVKNSSGATINKGAAVMAVGTDGNSGHILIDEMVADGSIEPKYFMGVLESTLANGEIGRVIHFGELDQFNTNAFNDGDILWCDPSNPGGFTVVEPNGPNVKIATAIVISAATNGKIKVRVQGNPGLHELHDVLANPVSTADGDLLQWAATPGVWTNRTLADIADSRYVNVSGDTMTGLLNANGGVKAGTGGQVSWGNLIVDTSLEAGWGTTNKFPYIGSTGGVGSLVMIHNPHVPFRTDNAVTGYDGRAGLRLARNASGDWWDVGLAGDFFHIYRSGSGEFLRIDNLGKVGIGSQDPSVSLEVIGDGTASTYRGVIRIGNTSNVQWAGLSFPDDVDAADSAKNNFWFIGRGASIADREFSFHIPNATNYGDTTQPKFRFASTGADTLMTLEASTGDMVVKGGVTAASIIKDGGTSSQFLKADGSVDGNTYLTDETDTLQSVTDRGATTTNSALFSYAGKTASFGTNANAPNATIADQTNYIQIVASGATDSMGVVFHNAGISTSALEYVNTTSNAGYFNFKSDDATWNLRVAGHQVWHAGNDGSGSGLDADTLDGFHLSGTSSISDKIFNNKGLSHSTFEDFNTVMNPGANYLQRGTNGPTGVLSDQWYGFMLGLGSDYGTSTGGAGDYASQLYWNRQSEGSNPYLWARDLENGTWGSWRKMSAGNADNADTLNGVAEGSFLRSDQDDTATGRITINNDSNSVNNPTLTITSSQGGGSFGRLMFSGTSTVAGVINRSVAGSDLFFDESTDTGNYYFRSSGRAYFLGTLAVGTTDTGGILNVRKDQNAGSISYLQNIDAGTSAYSELIIRSVDDENDLRLGTSKNYSETNWQGGWVFAPRTLLLKSNNDVKIFAGGTLNSDIVATFTSTGLGIGENNPDSRLHVSNGSAGTIDAHQNAIIAAESSGSGYINFLVPDEFESGILFGRPANRADGGIVYNNGNTRGLQFRTAGNSTKAWLTSNGDFGLGVDPAVRLHVSGSSILANNTSINPDDYTYSVVAGAIGMTGWGVFSAIGGSGSTGHTWGIGTNNVALYHAYGDGTNANSLQTYLRVETNRNIILGEGSAKVGILRAPASNERFTVNAGEGVWNLSVYNGDTHCGGIHTNSNILTIQSIDSDIVLDPSSGQVNVDGTLKADTLRVDGTNDGYFGYIQASWGGNTIYPTLYSAVSDRWVMLINPHISYTASGSNGYTGSMTGATIRMASNPAATAYWDVGVGVNSVGTDTFSIGRQGTSYLKISAGGAVSLDGDVQISPREYGSSMVGNFGQWQPHGTYTDFNTEPAIWGWNYMLGNVNGPNANSNQWYRGRFSLGDAYGKGSETGDYWMEIAIPRSNYTSNSAGQMFIRTCENGVEQSWKEVGSSISGNQDIKGHFRLNGGSGDQWPFFVTDQRVDGGASRYTLGTNGMGFNLADNYAQLQLVGSSGAYIDFVSGTSDDTDARMIYYNSLSRFDMTYGGSRLSQYGSYTFINQNLEVSGDIDATGYVRANGESLSQDLRVGGIYGDLGLYVANTYAMLFDLGWDGAFKFTRGGSIRMQINHDGKTSIGSADVDAKLHVRHDAGDNGSNGYGDYNILALTSGTGQATIGSMHAGDGYANLNLGSNVSGNNIFWHISKRISAQSHRLEYFYYNGSAFTSRFCFFNNGDFHADSDIVAYSSTISDAKFKDDVVTIDSALDKVMRLRGVEYTWNSGSRKGQRDLGLIAQEVEQVIPEIVREKTLVTGDFSENNETSKTVDYEKLVGVLIEAVKEQQQQINDLKSIIKNTNF